MTKGKNSDEPAVTWNPSTGKYVLHVPNGDYGSRISMEIEPPPFNPNVSLLDQLMAEYRHQVTATA